MPHYARTHHVQVYVLQAVPRVTASLYHRAVVPIAPETTASPFAAVVPLSELAFQLLHHRAYCLCIRSLCQQMCVVASN